MRWATIEELIRNFEMLDGWEERYEHILEMGDELEQMPEDLKTEENRVQGGVSNVWRLANVQPGDRPVVTFSADSDSQIVRGLIARLVTPCSGRTAEETSGLDIEGFFQKLGLRQYLSRSRSNGLYSVIKRSRTLAEQVAESGVDGGEPTTISRA